MDELSGRGLCSPVGGEGLLCSLLSSLVGLCVLLVMVMVMVLVLVMMLVQVQVPTLSLLARSRRLVELCNHGGVHPPALAQRKLFLLLMLLTWWPRQW